MKWFPIKAGSSFKWITYTFLISIIPVILFGTLLYYRGSQIVQEEIHRSSLSSLSQVRHQVETNMLNIEQMVDQLALQSDVIAVMNTQNETRLGASTRTNDLRDLLSQMKNVTDATHSIYFYHIGQEIVITQDTITFYYEDRVFRDLSWMGYVEEMVADKRLRMWVTPREVVRPNEQTESTLTFIRLLPILYNEPKAVIVVNLDPAFLNRTISRFPLDADGRLLIMNKEGQLIAQIPAEAGDPAQTEVFLRGMDQVSAGDGSTTRIGDHFLSVLQSSENGWTYAIAVPDHVPRQQVEGFGQLIVLITAVLCLLVVYSAYFTHRKFQLSIRTILDRVSSSRPSGQSRGKGDAIAEVEDQINHLIAEIKEKQSKQDVQLPLLRTHYLHAIIHANAVDISRLAREVEKSDLFPYSRFCVLVAQMDDSAKGSFHKDRELFLFAVSNIGMELTKLQAEDSPPFRIETIITDRHAVLVVNCPDSKETDQMPVLLADQLRSAVKKILKHTITIGVGTTVGSAHNLAYSYREALQALHMNLANAYDEVLPYANMTLVAQKLVQYPAAEEQDLLSALRARDIARAERSLQQFRAKLEGDLASFQMAKTFYLQLLVAVTRLVQEYEEDIVTVFGENPYDTFFRMASIWQIDDWFRSRLLAPIVGYIESVKRLKTDTLIKQTIELIHQRYASDLSLQMAADELGMNFSYLSKLFKEELGVTFIDYVTRIRLEKAQALLVETELTMQQVSQAIGYASVQQMFRVFKKKLGMTPGEYREKAAVR